MSDDEVGLWRDPNGSFVRDSVFGAVTHIAVPAAKHAALMRVVEAARALLDLLAYEHPDFGYSEIADLRAALAAQPAQAGEAVACLDCDAGHPRWVVPENGNVIHTLPGGMVNFCAAPSRPGGA